MAYYELVWRLYGRGRPQRSLQMPPQRSCHHNGHHNRPQRTLPNAQHWSMRPQREGVVISPLYASSISPRMVIFRSYTRLKQRAISTHSAALEDRPAVRVPVRWWRALAVVEAVVEAVVVVVDRAGGEGRGRVRCT